MPSCDALLLILHGTQQQGFFVVCRVFCMGPSERQTESLQAWLWLRCGYSELVSVHIYGRPATVGGVGQRSVVLALPWYVRDQRYI